MNTRDTLQAGVTDLGLAISPQQLSLFEKFMALLLEWNEKINLTAITDPDEVISKHFIDSLVPLTFVDKYNLNLAKILDMGTGGGFPGIPMKIMLPESEFLLVDSLKKRINYLKLVIQELNLENIQASHARAEELGQNPAHREEYTTVFSRAVASFNILAEYCLPFVQVGGFFVALKGPDLEKELNEAKKAIKKLGGEIVGVDQLDLPIIQDPRTLVFIKKVAPTAKKYPRRPGKPKKNPLS